MQATFCIYFFQQVYGFNDRLVGQTAEITIEFSGIILVVIAPDFGNIAG
jgi:hypothetical protein